MYKDVGKKIKSVAMAVFFINLVCFIALGIINISQMNTPTDQKVASLIIAIILGLVFAWLSGLLLYGFGELIDRASAIEEEMQALYKDVEHLTVKIAPEKINGFYTAKPVLNNDPVNSDSSEI